MAWETIEIVNKDGDQAINLPPELKIDDDKVIVKKVGNELHLIPYHSAWDSFFNSEIRVTDDFMETRDQGEDQERESLLMVAYLLDTNICIYILKRKLAEVFQKFQRIDPDTIGVSSITVAELMYGINKSSLPDRNLNAVNELLNNIQILDFNQHAASHYGIIKNTLLTKGTPIGPLDILIAAHTQRLNAILVSNNLKEFNRVEGLVTENWI